MNCWNCRLPADPGEDSAFCSRCGEALKPDSSQAQKACENVEYLLKEVERWDSAPLRWRLEVKKRYEARLQFLEPLREASAAPPLPRPKLVEASPAVAPEPVTRAPIEEDWTHHETAPSPPIASPSPPVTFPVPVAVPEEKHLPPINYKLRPEDLVPSEEDLRIKALEAGVIPRPSTPVEPGESLGDIRHALAERNVSGLMMVGALLLLAAYVGFLKAFWEDGIGKQLASLSMVASPAFFFWFAHLLRARLPQSSRLFSVVGGLLMPIGLLSMNHFHVLGLDMPSVVWSPLSFALSAGLLLFQAFRLPEVACLYLSVTSAFLAGLTTGNNFLLALAAFGGAAAILYVSTQSTSAELKPHYQRVSHLLAAGGLLSGVLRSQSSYESSATVFLVGAVYYAGSAYLGKSVKALVVSSLTGLAGFWACQNLLHLSSPMLGLCSIVQGSLYLSRAKKLLASSDESEKALGQASYALGVGVTGSVLLFTLGYSLIGGLWDSFAAYSAAEQHLCILTGGLGFLYYALAAYHYRNPSLLYASAASFVYGYLVLAVLTWHSQFELYRLLLIVLPLLWQALALGARAWIPREYLTPWVLSGALLAALIGPLNVISQAHQASPFDLAVYGTSALVFLGAALWQRQAAFLYPGLTAVVVGYTTFLLNQPHHDVHPNLGLLFFPLVAVLAGISYSLDRSGARDFATPVARVSLGLGIFFCLGQLAYMAAEQYATVVVPLLLYGAGFAGAGWLFGDYVTAEDKVAPSWTFGGTAWGDFAYCWSTLCILTAIVAADSVGVAGTGLALLLCGIGVAAGALLPSRMRATSKIAASLRGQVGAGLLWSLAPCFFGPHELALGSALVWVIPALLLPVPAEETPTSGPWLVAGWCATGLGFVGALRIGFGETALVGLALLMLLQLAVAWKRADQVTIFCALVSAVIGWRGGVSEQPESSLFLSWWFLQLIFSGFAFAAQRFRPVIYPMAQIVAKLLGVGILVVLPHDGWGCATALLYGGVSSLAGVLAGPTAEFAAGSCLLAWALLLGSIYFRLDAAFTALSWSILGWLYLVLSLALPTMRRFCLRFGPALTSLAWLWAGGFLGIHPATLPLLSCAALWAVRAMMVPDLEDTRDSALVPIGPSNYHMAFLFAYTAWLQVVPEGSPLEFWTAPLGVWLLFWTEALSGRRKETSDGVRKLGLVILLAPSVLFSLGSTTHSITALILGTVVLVLGTVLSQAAYMSLGPAALLIEIAIQALKVAVGFPWYVWALGAAVLIIGLAVFTDYRRRKQMASPGDKAI